MNEESPRKRTWMKIHTGILDAKHRETMGVRVWLFMYLIDNVDWNTGIVEGFIDHEAAEELEMPLSTLRKWRQDLQEAGYITCRPGDQCQRIVIHRWRNPREVNPEQMNVKEVIDFEEEEYPNMGTPPECPKMDTPPRSKMGTPSYRSDSLSHDSPEEKAPPAAPVEEPTPQPPTLPVDTAVKEAPKKPATPERWHELVGEIMTHFKEPGGFAAKLAAQLSGTSTDKARSQHNCNPPAKPEDIGPFVKHYRRHNQGASLPTSAENLERYWLKFVADTQPVQWVEPEPTPEEPLNPHDPYAFLKRKREERDRAREAAFLSAS